MRLCQNFFQKRLDGQLVLSLAGSLSGLMNKMRRTRLLSSYVINVDAGFSRRSYHLAEWRETRGFLVGHGVMVAPSGTRTCEERTRVELRGKIEVFTFPRPLNCVSPRSRVTDTGL